MLKLIISFILAVIMALFILQNTHIADVYFVTWHTRLSTSLLLLITFVIGIVLGFIVAKAKKKK